MFSQTLFLSEGTSTRKTADERFDSGVNPLVNVQVCLAAKRLSAEAAVKSFRHLKVDLPMPQQCSSVAESFLTNFANKGTNASMLGRVGDQRIFRGERSVASFDVAFVRRVVEMQLLVCVQSRVLIKRLSTQMAYE